ncbi:TetR/AcrR family transcriptional regulator [Halostagnicola bangensis]
MKGFSDEERERIRGELISSGRELFIQYGLERTRIKDITDEVNIGTSTFYQFFDSKEVLYGEVLLTEVERFNEDLEEQVENAADPREQVRINLKRTFEEVESNPIVKNLIVGDELRTFQSQLSTSNREALVEKLENNIFSSISEWTELDSFKFDDEVLVDELFRMLVFSTRAKNLSSGSETCEYDDARDALIDVVVDGLFEE